MTYDAEIILVAVQLASDMVSCPELNLVGGGSPVLSGSGFGFGNDSDTPARVAELDPLSLATSGDGI